MGGDDSFFLVRERHRWEGAKRRVTRGGRGAAPRPEMGNLVQLSIVSVFAVLAIPSFSLNLAGCSTTTASGCTQDSECTDGKHCYFAVTGGCFASGSCLDPPAIGACKAMIACGCNGVDVPLCAPAGYSPERIAHGNGCETESSNDAGGLTPADAATE